MAKKTARKIPRKGRKSLADGDGRSPRITISVDADRLARYRKAAGSQPFAQWVRDSLDAASRK